MRLNTNRLGGWGLVVGWDAFIVGVPGRYFGAGVRWPWESPSRRELPPGCTFNEGTFGWAWAVWGRRP